MNAMQSDRYILADISHNNNKFWNIIRYDDGRVVTHYGRVGEAGQQTEKRFGSEPEAVSFYEQKCREKSRKGYVPQRTLDGSPGAPVPIRNPDLKEVARQQIRTASPETQALVEYLAQANVHQILVSTTLRYDASRGTFSTPLGIVTQQAIDEARRLLTGISQYVAQDRHEDPGLVPLLNDYLMLIPQDIGRRRPDPRQLYPNLAAIQKQNDLLDSLEASLQLVLSGPTSSAPVPAPKLFECSLSLVEEGKEIDRIRRKFRETRQALHGSHILDVKRVYLVEIAGMRQAFEQDGARLTNIWELWHGSKKGNLLSILARGFQVPPSNASHCTGRLFGNGVYFSDQSTKSLNYCVSPEVRVLRKDLSWVPASELQVGNELLAFDEERGEGQIREGARRWRTSIVTNVGRAHLPSVEVVFDNGDRMVVSKDHRFLFCHTASAVSWRRAEDLKPGNTVPRYVETWKKPQDYDSGWIAGVFDGEGWSCKGSIGASQNPGIVYDKLSSLLEDRTHESWAISRKPSGSSPTHSVRQKGGVHNRLRFLGEVRPERVMRNHLSWLEGRIFQAYCYPKVVEVIDVGIREVVTLGTTTKTFLAEGYAAHNSWGYWDGKQDENCFMFLCNVALGRFYTPRGAGENLPRRGYDSTFAEGSKSGVLNNEMIVYRTSQIDPVFLIEFSRGGR
jgi:poly [ADP-ribose] polymerase